MDRGWLLTGLMIVGCGDLPDPGRSSPETRSPDAWPASDAGEACDDVVLLEREAAYWQGVEPVVTWASVLTLTDAPDHPYEFRDFRVFAGASEPLLRAFVGRRVTVRGRVIDVGQGSQLWVGALIRPCGGD